MRAVINGKEIPLGGGASLTPGDGITIQDNTVSVTTPVKGLTQVEYDALSEEEKSRGLYIVTDTNIDLNDRGDVYSTEETRIGTWIDGKPLYRKVVVSDPINITGDNINIYTGPLEEYIVKMEYAIIFKDGTLDIRYGSFYHDTNNRGIVTQKAPNVVVAWLGSSWIPSRVRLILEYTKTTDQGAST